MTDMQMKLFTGYRMNIGNSLEDELTDNCNPINWRNAARICEITKQQANGLLVSMDNAGWIQDDSDGEGMPLYMFTSKGVREWYKINGKI